MADPFARMAETLTGAAPPAMRTRAETTAALFRRAAAALRVPGEADLLQMAQGFEQWLATGGDLDELLGAKARRGRRHDLPAAAAREHAKREAVRQMAQTLDLATEPPAQAAKILAHIMARPFGDKLLRAVAPGIKVPRSAAQLARLLRDMKC